MLAFYTPDRALEGKSLANIAASRGAPSAETALDLIERGDASIVSFNMSEADIVHIMRQPYTMTSSDGDLVPMGAGRPHPRNYANPHQLAAGMAYVLVNGQVVMDEAKFGSAMPGRVLRKGVEPQLAPRDELIQKRLGARSGAPPAFTRSASLRAQFPRRPALPRHDRREDVMRRDVAEVEVRGESAGRAVLQLRVVASVARQPGVQKLLEAPRRFCRPASHR